MAFLHLKFQQIFYILRVLGTITNTWPPHPDIKKILLLLHNIYYYVSLFIFSLGWIGMFMSAYRNRNNNLSELMINVSHLTCFTEAILSSILCTINRKQLQNLVVHIEEFMKLSKDREKVILQKYTDRYATFLTTVAISFSMAGFSVICAPLFTPKDFPLNTWYPFSTEPLIRKFFLYIIQIVAVLHTTFSINADVMIALFFFYSTSRIEMLAFEIEHATNEAHVISSIRKHQEIIEFVSSTQQAIKYILLKTNFTMAFTVISGGFPLLYVQSSILIPQFISMAVAALQRLFITAWTADDLKEVSTRLSWSIYSASWTGKTQKMKTDILIMLQRSQRSLLISMGGLLPALTLEYYASFVTMVLSYFMTMRVVLSA